MIIPYPHIPPVLVRVGPFAVRWYGVMYLVGYFVGYRIMRARIEQGLISLTRRDLDSLIGYLLAGMVLGARLMYAIVYEPGHYLDDPAEFVRIWHGGLSFHGALIGMTIAAGVFARVHRVAFWKVADTLALAGTPGLFFGRIGNFINGELYGRVTTAPCWSPDSRCSDSCSPRAVRLRTRDKGLRRVIARAEGALQGVHQSTSVLFGGL